MYRWLIKSFSGDSLIELLWKLLCSFVIFLSVYFAPIAVKGLSIMVLLLIDTGTGVWNAVRDPDEQFTSLALSRVILKFITYTIALITSNIFANEFGVDILTVVAFGLASVEVISIFENLYKITGVEFFKNIQKKIKGKNSNK